MTGMQLEAVDDGLAILGLPQCHVSRIPETLPNLLVGEGRTFLDYGGLLIPVSEEQARHHQICLLQHLQEVAYGF